MSLPGLDRSNLIHWLPENPGWKLVMYFDPLQQAVSPGRNLPNEFSIEQRTGNGFFMFLMCFLPGFEIFVWSNMKSVVFLSAQWAASQTWQLMWVVHWQYLRGNMMQFSCLNKQRDTNCQVNQVNLPKASVGLAFAACALHIQLFRSKLWGNHDGIEADTTWHHIPTNILHSSDSAVCVSLTRTHSSENVSSKEATK